MWDMRVTDWRDSDSDFSLTSPCESMCGVNVHTLGLGDNFGSTAPPAVHHWGTGPSGAARALSPGTNTTWMIGEGERVGKGGRVSLICMNYLNVFTPTLDRDAGEEKVCRGQNGEDLDEGRWDSPWKHTGGKQTNRIILNVRFNLKVKRPTSWERWTNILYIPPGRSIVYA